MVMCGRCAGVCELSDIYRAVHIWACSCRHDKCAHLMVKCWVCMRLHNYVY